MSNEKFDFTLSLNNVKHIPIDQYDPNFTFIVNGRRYKTSRIVSDLLSPKIRQLHYQDPTFDEYSIHINEQLLSESNNENYFNEFLTLVHFDNKRINEIERKLFIQYFIQLGNIDECMRLQPDYFSEMTPNNAIERLINLIEHIKEEIKETGAEPFLYNEIIAKIINYISSKFYEVNKEKLIYIDKNIIERIISNENFQISSEDELNEVILELYKHDHKYASLFEYVIFENLSEENIKQFVEHFNINDIEFSIWKSICKRLVQTKPTKSFDSTSNSRYKNEIIEKKQDSEHEFNGLLKYLTDKTGGNIHDNGTIEITSNSIYGNSESKHPKHITDNQNNNTSYDSADKVNSEIVLDFKNYKIQMSSYSLKSYNCNPNSGNLKNRIVEVSKEGENWEKVDEHNNDSTLNGNYKIGTFKTKETTTFYRFIRIKQTGTNWRNNYDTYICSFEIYGKLLIQRNKK